MPGRCAFPSDTNLLVDACIARVREAAFLDEDVVLPPLPVVAPRRDVIVMTKSDTEAAGRAGAATATAGRDDAKARRHEETRVVRNPRSRSSRAGSRWPMAICGFVAGAAACAALLASPIGHRPEVVRVTVSARSHASHAAHAAGAAVAKVVR
jgi:hypothetical protein